VQPAILEELVGCVATALNAIARNFRGEFPEWRATLSEHVDYHKVADLVDRTGRKIESVKKFIDPPLVSYAKGEEEKTNSTASVTTADGKKDSGEARSGSSNFAAVFAWVLVGTSAMFLLFLANTVLLDLLREVRFRTFARYRTLREGLLPFIGGKVLFAIVFLLFCSAVLLYGGGLVFHIHWQRPLPLAALCFAYAACAAGVMVLVVALTRDERRAATLNSIVGLLFGMLGGCMVAPSSLPRFVESHITPVLPTYWFVNTVRQLQFDPTAPDWVLVVVRLLVVGAVLLALAVAWFQRRFKNAQA